jgi:CubicO group peptidase (beta-lactamase class C family)
MNKVKILVFIIIVLFLPSTATSQNFEPEIDNLYQVKNNDPGFSVAVFEGNKIIFEKQYGSSNLGYNIPVTKETIFDIGSIAKQFTAAAILLLEQEGKLSIKDPAYKYVDNLPRYKKGNPTIEQLLNQTSGIKEVDYYMEVMDFHSQDYISQSQVINIITKVSELRFTPGEYFYYTNANYILLASIIEKASEKQYSTYLQEHIFTPLNMEHTLVNNNRHEIIKNRAIGYTEDEGQFYKTHQYSLRQLGDGQILTNTNDMFEWHKGITNATIGTREIWKRMHTKAKLNNGTTINYGLGVEFETYNGYEAIGFDGMIMSGFVSKYLYFPKLDIAFFTTQNTFDWDFKERFFKLVDLYIPAKKAKNLTSKYSKVKLSDKEMKIYEGKYLFYYNDEGRKANSVKLNNNQLQVFTLDGDEISKLIPIGNHKFLFGEDENAIVEFSFNENKKQYTYDDFENETPWLFKEFNSYEHSKKELKEYEGQYFNKDFQISKKLQIENGKLYYYYRNGAWKHEITSLSKDLLEVPNSPIEFIRNEKNKITSFIIMGLVFENI